MLLLSNFMKLAETKYKFIHMNINGYSYLLSQPGVSSYLDIFLDIKTNRSILQGNVVGVIFGKSIIISKAIPDFYYIACDHSNPLDSIDEYKTLEVLES